MWFWSTESHRSTQLRFLLEWSRDEHRRDLKKEALLAQGGYLRFLFLEDEKEFIHSFTYSLIHSYIHPFTGSLNMPGTGTRWR